jgi:starch synthase (maltosyl-transferring)
MVQIDGSIMSSPPAGQPPPIAIERVEPEIDCGRFPIKRIAGDRVIVEADIFAHGHDAIACALLYRFEGEGRWSEAPMEPLANDRWRGSFRVERLGRYLYTIEAWPDRFATWRRDFEKRAAAGAFDRTDLVIGADLVAAAAARASAPAREKLARHAERLRAAGSDAASAALDPELASLMAQHPDRRLAARYPRELAVVVDRERARFSSWYELFPRSCAREPGRHGTFRDLIERLPYVASMGFDVLYLPPIHPIGRTHRKGKNNAVTASPGDPGSPWAIGAREGGHKAIHPELGTVRDFEALVEKAKEHGIEIALDIAFQCSPDHPYVKEHPRWFRWRPDGTVQYAENPPKRYEDIYPLEFDTEDFRSLWEELKSVIDYWIGLGVRIFRVDNPHTKPFAFWEWLIAEIKKAHPDVIFLSEAFTRPKVMYRLAKLGFSQSYTYFAWRNTKAELTDYFTELTRTPVREFFRPHLWPNTPDILSEYLQSGGRPAFMARLILAATLGASYGIYGPAFELCESQPREPGSEEYLNSEKYEIKSWDWERPDSLRELIGRVNRIRRENPALRQDWNLAFHPVDNENLLCFSKRTEESANLIVAVVNLDAFHTQSGWVTLPLDSLGIDPAQPYQMHDLLTGARYIWHGPRNYVELNPAVLPAHIFRVRRRLRREHDFDYYL